MSGEGELMRLLAGFGAAVIFLWVARVLWTFIRLCVRDDAPRARAVVPCVGPCTPSRHSALTGYIPVGECGSDQVESASTLQARRMNNARRSWERLNYNRERLDGDVVEGEYREISGCARGALLPGEQAEPIHIGRARVAVRSRW